MNIDPGPITAWFALFIAIATTVSLIVAAVIRVNRNFEQRVTYLIKEVTQSIQPGANGGLSMTDLHTKMDRFERKYEELMEQQEVQRQLWHERYIDDQQRVRREWTAVFIAIRKMMGLPQEEQVRMWDDITEDYVNGTIGDKYPDERKNDG